MAVAIIKIVGGGCQMQTGLVSAIIVMEHNDWQSSKGGVISQLVSNEIVWGQDRNPDS
ncbi:hypothetical protein [Flavobacterium poyangense]|uniref:hypothetical protein n=1 Tax=Flavobacterium poyangense TaxID=2204302 RepID=UPI00141DBFDD|nr:hypothetical protein [Flavobacterium sp. JXAS1]